MDLYFHISSLLIKLCTTENCNVVASCTPQHSTILDVRQPRSQGLSSSRRETLVWAGHVSMYTNEILIGGGSLT